MPLALDYRKPAPKKKNASFESKNINNDTSVKEIKKKKTFCNLVKEVGYYP